MGRYSITTVMVNMELISESSWLAESGQSMHIVGGLTVIEKKNAVSNGKMKYGLLKALLKLDNQLLTTCISAHESSTNPLHPEMNSSGCFMEWNRTIGKTQNSSVTSNCSVQTIATVRMYIAVLFSTFHSMNAQLRWL